MSDINLAFINRSTDVNNSSIVIFQKNVATDFDELSVAWRVVENCGRYMRHLFTYPKKMQVGASDSYGNTTPLLDAENSHMFAVTKNTSGNELKLVGPSASTDEVQVKNSLATGSINANIYKGGKLLAVKTGVAPQQKAVFEFHPTIWIGVVSQIEEGEIMNSAILSDINTELSLTGIASADIVMTGGGTGKNATPFKFELQNIVKA
ncbi:MAG: hypothetical protein ACJA0U_000420 [Salibacteraceae bacterium]|jgi:hypothetical protein